ncbi:MAG: glycerophosphodiester phosphodiesterase [Gemmatimonadales bacterium]
MTDPRILAHRGASGQAHENTLEAFRLARQLGADGVELDVHASGDGHLIVHHDSGIPGLGAIRAASLEAIRQVSLPHGQAVPTLEEALEALSGLEVWVEIKTLPPEVDPRLVSILESSRDSCRLGVHSFDHRIVARLGSAGSWLRRGVLSASYPIAPVRAVLKAGANALWQQWHLIDADLVRAAHDAGVEVIAWTVNSAVDARGLAELGVDALCGNYPERLRAS